MTRSGRGWEGGVADGERRAPVHSSATNTLALPSSALVFLTALASSWHFYVFSVACLSLTACEDVDWSGRNFMCFIGCRLHCPGPLLTQQTHNKCYYFRKPREACTPVNYSSYPVMLQFVNECGMDRTTNKEFCGPQEGSDVILLAFVC